MNYALCIEILKKYDTDSIRDLIALYQNAYEDSELYKRTISDLKHQIMILEAENKFLKELNA